MNQMRSSVSTPKSSPSSPNGPWQASLFPSGSRYFLAQGLDLPRAAELARELETILAEARSEPPAQWRLGASLYRLASLMTAKDLSEEDRSQLTRLADAHQLRGFGLQARLACAGNAAHLTLRLRLEDLLLALQVLSRAQAATP